MNLGIFFLIIALVFAVFSMWDYLKPGSKLTAARKTWLIIAAIFAVVGLLNLLIH